MFSYSIFCPVTVSVWARVVIFSYSPSHAVTSVSVWHRPHQSVNNHDIKRLQTPVHRQQIMKILANLITLWTAIGIKFFKDRKAISCCFLQFWLHDKCLRFDVFFSLCNNLILRRNKFSKHEMLHQPRHVLKGVNSGNIYSTNRSEFRMTHF